MTKACFLLQVLVRLCFALLIQKRDQAEYLKYLLVASF